MRGRPRAPGGGKGKRAGVWRVGQQRYAEAEAEFRDLVEKVDEPLEPLNGLAICLDRQRRFGEAVAVARECLALAERSLGPEHPSCALLRSNLARFLRLAGELEEARELQEPAKATLVDALGATHPFALAATFELGLLLRELGEDEAARALVEQVVSAGSSRPEGLSFLDQARQVLEQLEAGSAASAE